MADIIEQAREEYRETGTLAVDTFMKLTGAGFNGSVLMAQFETEGETE